MYLMDVLINLYKNLNQIILITNLKNSLGASNYKNCKNVFSSARNNLNLVKWVVTKGLFN